MPQTIYDKLKEGDPSIRRTKILEALESEDLYVIYSDTLENEMVLNMGPQHPATHGVLRLLIKLDGEKVIRAVPDIGYLHRGYEKLAENCISRIYSPYRQTGLFTTSS